MQREDSRKGGQISKRTHTEVVTGEILGEGGTGATDAQPAIPNGIRKSKAKRLRWFIFRPLEFFWSVNT